ncbi:hypothetical protein [Ktedonobacter racemifer]|uniref:Uncharacterized protein n=1 Tax=Ktedonobacter racemifer DSM 44963 TaxID=485913 RepID=D6TX97_KTERA|nr:hypothetical protein [Ktedonobacter racemifer]EFH84830.1 hypothetical protein Krac_5943 [Ktedonobacter racemifer DSM 44963]
MSGRPSSHLIWAIFGIVGPAVVLINFFLPYIFVNSYDVARSQSLWGMAVTSPPNIQYFVAGAVVLYWLAILLPMGAAFSVLLRRGKKSRALLGFSIVLAVLGFLMSLIFDLFTMVFAGFGMPSRHLPALSFSFGPNFWLAPIGFLLSLGSCLFFLSRKTELHSSNTLPKVSEIS